MLPFPGGGRTLERFRALAASSAEDTVLGRMIEAHADAAAILHELDGPAPASGQIWGVWAAEPPDPVLRARATASGWVLDGRKLWCSGASICSHALVTARDGEQRRLFAVSLSQPGVRAVPGSWHAVGMRESDSGAVDFDVARAVPVGENGDYLDRAGFWHGAVGVAACWYGSACRVVRPLHERAARGRADEHALAHLGAVAAALSAARLGLSAAAGEIDADPDGDRSRSRIRARTVRALVEDAVTATVDRVGRALGAGPLCMDAEHARRVADLTVYVRQSHAEADLADLGRDIAGQEFIWPDL
ncbi:acyl-CoA dehydrogenase family protein [Nocardia sp. NBC_01503]|uniref:acyl-CoA dehydrogenase family protein n=1 Tax=Nocardia sp. NBC_01503 TaxID=2975997 RepID=UPI002E7BBDDA|nr:acyl-CoA dehydrogenase family protein [Nocardia sp. NBC_01503]WTL36552.1 acyl-CoA dehydrogenase family protein [Nocardia sp. NBC_01503]